MQETYGLVRIFRRRLKCTFPSCTLIHHRRESYFLVELITRKRISYDIIVRVGKFISISSVAPDMHHFCSHQPIKVCKKLAEPHAAQLSPLLLPHHRPSHPSLFRSLRTLLDSEMEHSAVVRGQLEETQKGVKEQEDGYKAQIQSLSRENNVLKNQLKKYVGAVQMLRRDGPTAVEGKRLHLSSVVQPQCNVVSTGY